MADVPSLSRRHFLALASSSAALAAISCTTLKAMAKATPISMSELTRLSASEAVAKISHGEVTAEKYATALIERCEQCSALNAFITFPKERVLEAARAADRFRTSGGKLGPLHGLPIPVKDSVNTKDMPTTGGTPVRSFQPRENAPIVDALLRAGAI